jgi:hypothetical protein
LKIRFYSDRKIGRFVVILRMNFVTDELLGLRNDPNFKIAKRGNRSCRGWN